MDLPIEIYTKTKTEKNKNNLYNRYYICTQNVGYIECERYNNYEQLKKQNNLFLSKCDDKEYTNGVFPNCNFSYVYFKIYNFIPSCFDNIILKYNLHNLLKIIVKK
jgi:hypothetical protein